MGLQIKKMAPRLQDDFMDFFDNVAFADNPDWGGCYCRFFHFQGSIKEWGATTKAENRAAASARIQQDNQPGFLLYEGSEVVGWANAGPKASYPRIFQNNKLTTPEDKRVVSVVCFLVAPGRRRQGLASSLLEGICESFPDHIIEAYPHTVAGPSDEEAHDGEHYHGPLQMYLNHGFQIVSEEGQVATVRKYPGQTQKA